MNEESTWGTTAHIMEEKFDTGDIVFSNTFEICKETETAFSLRQKSREKLFDLLKEFVNVLKKDIPVKKIKQTGQSKYFSKKMLNETRIIQEKDSHAVIDKKIRAFWCPPHPGAAININGKEYIIINNQIIKQR
jgi:methionyl-tRNA formyltransferase